MTIALTLNNSSKAKKAPAKEPLKSKPKKPPMTLGGTKPKRVPTHQCPFCLTKYKREETLLTHKCIKRDRYLNKDSRTFREAFQYWMMFNKFYHIKLKSKEELEMQFVQFRYFNDFHDFADYVMDNNILFKDEFVKHMLTSGISVNLWRTHQTLAEWVLTNIRNESPTSGVERSIVAMIEWGTSTGYEWTDFFKLCSAPRLLMWFESGKLSPWILYAGSDKNRADIIERLSDSEMAELNKYITPVVWKPLQRLNITEVQGLRQLLGEYKL